MVLGRNSRWGCLVVACVCLSVLTGRPAPLFLVSAGRASGSGRFDHGDLATPGELDPYAVLGVSKDDAQDAIRSAFRKLSLRYHPDKHGDDPDAREKFNQIAEAYEILGDADKRRIFDEFGTQKFQTREQYEESLKSGHAAAGPSGGGAGLYSGSAVLTLQRRNFTAPLRRPMLVKFFAPWCVHCQNLSPEFKRAALLLDGDVDVGAVNCDDNQGLCQEQRIQHYPTVRLYFPDQQGSRQTEQEEFPEPVRDAEHLVSFVSEITSAPIRHVNPHTFRTQVRPGKQLWIVEYFTPWCGPCNAMKPIIRRLAKSLEGLANVGVVNCEQHSQLCQEQGIPYYPDVRLYFKGQAKQLTLARSNMPSWQIMDLTEQVLQVVLPGAGVNTRATWSETEDVDIEVEVEAGGL